MNYTTVELIVTVCLKDRSRSKAGADDKNIYHKNKYRKVGEEKEIVLVTESTKIMLIIVGKNT
jgi:hypothetical protein